MQENRPMQSDSDLVARVLIVGDSRAFSVLVERHQSAIRGFLRRLTAGDHAAADDLAQETFLNAYRKLHTWQGTAQFNTWLHKIAYRKFLEQLRKAGRQERIAQLAEPQIDFTQPADAEIMAQQLMRLLGPEDRVCLTLAYSAGLSHGEIAGLVGLPLGSVKSRIHRARLKLQNWLNEHDYSFQNENVAAEPEQCHAG
jgi:RNA polymerase sigma-70 factor (ECF subfamily)